MNEKPIKVLLVEDNPGDARLIQEMLNDVENVVFELEHVDRLSAGLDRLAQGGIDISLLDLTLPDSSGLDTFTAIHTEAPSIPVVVLSGMADEELAIKAVAEGAQDYLNKGQVDGNLLERALRHAIERQRLIDQLEQAQKQRLDMKDEFLSHVSHELRTPLTAIHQFVTILIDGLAGELNVEQQDYLDITLKNVLQLRAMIGDLLKVTRAETGKLVVDQKCTFLPELVDDIIETLRITAAEKSIELFTEISNDLPPVYVDPERVKEILTNLIENAIKFTPTDGQITVKARDCSEDASFVCVSVSDTGQGISAEEEEKVFGYLYQVEGCSESSRKGIGLGLYVCKKLVTLHGGRIWVESKPGQGSTFFFTLPILAFTSYFKPTLAAKVNSVNSVGLITIEISPLNRRRLSKVDDPVLRKTWEIIERSTISSRDVLLPRTMHTPTGEVSFVVTSTERVGLELLEEQIKNRLASYDDFRNTSLGMTISHDIVNVSAIRERTSPQQLVGEVSCEVEDRVRKNIVNFYRRGR